MDIAWRFRIILAMAFVVIVFGDLLGYGSTKYEKKDRSIFSKIARISEQSDTTEIESDSSVTAFTNGKQSELSKEKIGNALREACLPKLLCEMAAKPNYSLNIREKDLLQLIRSTTLSLTLAVTPTKWHFAAHMGQLLRDFGSDLASPLGCSYLWPNCPYSSKKLMRLTSVAQLS